MTIVLNTLENIVASQHISTLINDADMGVINTSGMKISHCMGCNLCWLKTPGICAIKDDYEGIIRKLVGAENLWLVSDTRFGFLDWHGKRVMDREDIRIYESGWHHRWCQSLFIYRYK